MKSAVVEKPGIVTVKELPMPEPGAGEVLIRVKASGICGTDVHIYRGEYLGSYPIVPGHEFSGIVEKTGARVTRFSKGDRVAVEPNIACDNCPSCLNNRQNFCENWQAVGVSMPGGMSEYVVAPEKAVFSVGDIPFEQAAFVEPLSCVLHGVERARVRMGDRVLIIGAGPIGLLLSKVIQLNGACCISQVDRNKTRLALASESGAAFTYDSLEKVPCADFDLVVDATGVPALMEKTLSYARKGGTILLFGVPPAGKTITLPAFTIFQHGLTILSSFTSVRNSIQAVRLLESGKIDVSKLVSHTLPLEKLEEGLRMMETGAEGALKILIAP